jgi:hypothetical protein
MLNTESRGLRIAKKARMWGVGYSRELTTAGIPTRKDEGRMFVAPEQLKHVLKQHHETVAANESSGAFGVQAGRVRAIYGLRDREIRPCNNPE